MVYESHLRRRTFLPNLGTLGLYVLELFAIYATDGHTDGRTKATLTSPSPTVGGMIVNNIKKLSNKDVVTVSLNYVYSK